MTRNDVLAEYVRTYYPEIENSFGFACYSAGVTLREFGKVLKKALLETVVKTDESEEQ